MIYKQFKQLYEVGYVLVPFKLLGDKNLSPQAKVLWAYIFNTGITLDDCDETLVKICNDLEISYKEYKLYMEELCENGYRESIEG
ncbi:MAG: hypothetical protein K2N51_17055 [Lachnospiraceae bacterium]|nr:hypothetical protein [Lachnospiraceae bacterium]